MYLYPTLPFASFEALQRESYSRCSRLSSHLDAVISRIFSERSFKSTLRGLTSAFGFSASASTLDRSINVAGYFPLLGPGIAAYRLIRLLTGERSRYSKDWEVEDLSTIARSLLEFGGCGVTLQLLDLSVFFFTQLFSTLSFNRQEG